MPEDRAQVYILDGTYRPRSVRTNPPSIILRTLHASHSTNMAPPTHCAALNAAITKTGMSYGQIAQQMGTSEAYVSDVCSGRVHPTAAEFSKLSSVLGITDAPPRDSAHATK
ncbi:hypothetical protein OF83DRAFT_1119861 [Amylostereum chailletii]|nr:hypothetical protein OF83DRAFT_1119861 [Amylostereum chailletii]